MKKYFYYFIQFAFLTVFFMLSTQIFSAPKNNETITEKEIKTQNESFQNSDLINLYQPNYVLPFYYTASPYYQIYQGNTPNNQPLKKQEFKAQFSFLAPIIRHFLHPNWLLAVAYTQKMYWQFYANSQYFRETNYEPEIFLQTPIHRNGLFHISINHQSNGRGGSLERSWNRLIAQYTYASENYMVQVNLWNLIFQGQSSDLHNPDIAHYLGYDRVTLSYKIDKLVASLTMSNLESGLSRGHVIASLSYPLTKAIRLYGQYFNGFGQSLIEYNHRTQAAGIGIALNDWI